MTNERITTDELIENIIYYYDQQCDLPDAAKDAGTIYGMAQDISSLKKENEGLKLAHAKMTVLLKGVNDERDSLVAQLHKLDEEDTELIATLRAKLSGAEKLCKIYFDIASEAIGENMVRIIRDDRIKASTSGIAEGGG